MNLDAEVRKVEQVRTCLIANPELSTVQASSLSKIGDLLGEGELERQAHCQATRSRRRGSRILLWDIYDRFGVEILFLCSIAFSITKLSEIKKNDTSFLSRLGSWRRTVQMTQNICNLARERFAPYAELLPPATGESTGTKRRPCFESSATKRVRTNSNTPGSGIRPNIHGVRDLVPNGEQTGETYDDSDDSDGSNGSNGSNGSDVGLEPGDGTGVHNNDDNCVADTRLTGVDDVPLYANVYNLEALDVIRVVAAQTSEYRLTMPHLPDSMPFITIQCPPTLAMQFLTKRQQVKW